MIRLFNQDCMEAMRGIESGSVQCCVTSPPYYGLRDYGCDGQIGLEATPEEYIEKLVAVFREVKRVLRDDGTVWLNLGDSYANNRGTGASPLMGEKQATNIGSHLGRLIVPDGLKPKDLIGIPWRVAFALQADGWWLRQDIIWNKPNPMPESVTDRCTKAHEYIFLLTKSARYFYDADAIKEPCQWSGSWSASNTHTAVAQGGNHGKTSIFNQRWTDKNGGRNRRSVWTITTKPFKEAHFATFPPEIPEICIKAGSRVGDTILDPFMGSGTTGLVAEKLQRNFVGIELNPEYLKMAKDRIYNVAPR